MLMLADESNNVRSKSVDAILRFRGGAKFENKPVVLQMNFEAKYYSDITSLVYQPIFTKLFHGVKGNLK